MASPVKKPKIIKRVSGRERGGQNNKRKSMEGQGWGHSVRTHTHTHTGVTLQWHSSAERDRAAELFLSRWSVCVAVCAAFFFFFFFKCLRTCLTLTWELTSGPDVCLRHKRPASHKQTHMFLSPNSTCNIKKNCYSGFLHNYTFSKHGDSQKVALFPHLSSIWKSVCVCLRVLQCWLPGPLLSFNSDQWLLLCPCPGLSWLSLSHTSTLMGGTKKK